MRDCVQEEDEAWAYFLFYGHFGYLSGEEWVVTETEETCAGHLCLSLLWLRGLLTARLTDDLRLLQEVVAIIDPLLKDQYSEALESAVEGVKEKLGKGAEQGRANIP